MNKVVLIGNLSRDVEFGVTASGVEYAKFGIAVNRRFNREEVDFINCIAWRKTAELCNTYLSKGKKVGISGSLQISSYEGKDGVKRQSADVIIDEIEFLSSPQEQPKKTIHDLTPVDTEELPF